MVDLDPGALFAQNLSPQDVVNAINDQSIILPSGTVKIGPNQYNVKLNSQPEGVSAFNNLPIKNVNGTPIYVKDVAHVRDGFAVQTNIVRHNGRRGALLTVLKNGAASTLDIVSRLKKILPRVVSTLPSAMKVNLMFDQSIFVRAAIQGVLKEAIIAALLTGLMILLFLGSWRSTVIVCVSIPLSILTSLAIMHLLNETINVMIWAGSRWRSASWWMTLRSKSRISTAISRSANRFCGRFWMVRSRSRSRRSSPHSAFALYSYR